MPRLWWLRTLAALAHSGQLVGRSKAALSATAARQSSCEGFFLHIHQALKVLLGSTSMGLIGAFLVGCHSAAMSGCTACRLLQRHGSRLAQKGHPLPSLARSLILVDHSCGAPQMGHWHSHTTRCSSCEPNVTLLASKPGFFSGCIWAIRSGRPTARKGSPASPAVNLLQVAFVN